MIKGWKNAYKTQLITCNQAKIKLVLDSNGIVNDTGGLVPNVSNRSRGVSSFSM